MKRAYTQYIPRLPGYAKSRGMDPGDAVEAVVASAIRNYGSVSGVDAARSDILSFTLVSEYMLMTGAVTHLYLPGREFCDWLVNATTVVSLDTIKVVMDEIDMSNRYPGISMPSELVGQSVYNPVVLHFPADAKIASFMLSYLPDRKRLCASDDNREPPALLVSSNNHSGEVSSIIHSMQPTGTADDIDYIEYRTRLVCGLGMYTNCFPEAKIPGVPEDLKHPAHHKYAGCTTIQVVSRIRGGGTHASPMGHFRQGHFRTLTSARYTKKRFQVIWIDQTFVNGKAETILSTEEVK